MSEQMMQMRPSQVITNTFVNTEYNLYLHGSIGEADEMMEHYSVYHQAGPNDVIKLWLVSPGGSLATGSEYVAHMQRCQAPIIGVVGLETASMATAIAMNCDDLEITDMSTFCVHGFSYGAGGVEHSVYNQAVFNKKLNERWVRNTYTGFLSEQEISDTLRGVDILLDSEELKTRWAQFKLYREKQPCDCGEADCPQNLRLAQDAEEESFEELHISLEDMIAQAVEAGVKKALAARDKAEAKKAKKAVDKPVEEA